MGILEGVNLASIQSYSSRVQVNTLESTLRKYESTDWVLYVGAEFLDWG